MGLGEARHRKEKGQPRATPRPPIEVGIYFDLRNPPQWHQSPSRLYGFTLEACEEAERLGASSLWFSEHHLFDDDYLASPLTFRPPLLPGPRVPDWGRRS